jgi:hypothetical protein
MQIDFSYSTAQVKKISNGTYFVKLHFPNLGFYVNGIRVVPSKLIEDEHVVYKPAILNAKGEWKTNYDYEKSCELWLYFKELALKAVDEYDDASDVFDDWEGKST